MPSLTRRPVRAESGSWPGFPPRISVHESTTYHWSLLEDVSGYRAAGVPGIGLWRRKLADFGEEKGIDLVRDSGLPVSSFSCAGGFTGGDGHTFRDMLCDARAALETAIALRAGCLVVVSGPQAGHTFNHARRLVRDALCELGDLAGPQGVQIALQYRHGNPVEQHSFLPHLDAAAELVAMCDHPHVGLVFDFFHAWREVDVCERIPRIVPFIKLAALTDVQLPAQTDDHRCLPGTGVLPLAKIVGALEGAGYCGAYDLRLTSQRCRDANYDDLLRDCLSAVRQMLPELLVDSSAAPARADLPSAALHATSAVVPPR